MLEDNFESKLRDVFSDMVVLKNPERTEFFSNLSLPSYMRDWLVMKFSDDDGSIDYDSVLRYIRQYIPSREDYEQFKFEMINGDTVRFLARIRVSVDIKNGKTKFELPDFGGAKAGATGEVANDVVSKWKDTLLKESENWGVIELAWGKDYSTKQSKGVVKLIDYTPFCPYTIDLDFYKEARQSFSTEEWINVLISAADYNPAGYDNEEQKLYFLRRLLPFVEKRVNIMELAPKGTGKSYVYQKISKRGWLISGGTVSRASLIYDNAKKTGGLLTRFDYVGFDEIQSMTFVQPNQIQTALKDYMEFGEVQGFDSQIVADAGIIVLGNIDASRFSEDQNMMEEVSPVFKESAALDRFHGFIPGWKIPRMHQGLIANGWALNTEYFTEVLHELREDLSYATLVDECLSIPQKPDKRDLTAIKRLCTALVKLIFPQAKSKSDIKPEEFIKYCVQWALDNCQDDLAFLNKMIDKTLIERLQSVVSTDFVRLTYTEGIKILEDAIAGGKKFEFPISWGGDLASEHERYLVEEHFKKPVIMTDYPREIKAFYMKTNEDGKTMQGTDVLFPQIGEIIGGSVREENYDKLMHEIEVRNIPMKDMWWYLDTRKFGSCPHAGFGLGFERLILFVTGMQNIRDVIPFPRTPKTAEF